MDRNEASEDVQMQRKVKRDWLDVVLGPLYYVVLAGQTFKLWIKEKVKTWKSN